jgi:hypothetical protein
MEEGKGRSKKSKVSASKCREANSADKADLALLSREALRSIL